MIQHIYALVTNAHEIFYIGRTICPNRRLQEHKRNSNDPLSTEDKYIFIRQLVSCGGTWNMQVLATYTDNNHNYEDFWIYQCALQGIKLYNMKAGSIYTEAEKLMSKSYDEPLEFFAHREQLAKQLAKISQKPTKKSYEYSNLTRDAINYKPTISKGLQAIRDKQAKARKTDK